jgi:transcriptional regulator with XRE-family HTH domain
MGAISETLRCDLLQPEFSEGYAESFQDALVATQIKVLREDNHWTQADLAAKIGTTQTAISRIENVNYSAWNISTLKKLARAFRVRLKVSFETYGSLIQDMEGFSRESLLRPPREKDPGLRIEEPRPTVRLRKVHSSHLIVKRGSRRKPLLQRKPPCLDRQPNVPQPPTSASRQEFIGQEINHNNSAAPCYHVRVNGNEANGVLNYGT